MQLKVMVVALSIALAATAAAKAQLCSLALGTSGTLGLSGDATVLGSEQGLGTPGTMTIISIGANQIDIAAPVRISSPGSYNPALEQVEVAYSGLGGLATVSQGYTSSPTGFNVGTIAISTLLLHNRLVNPDGFAAGNYITRTTITCS